MDAKELARMAAQTQTAMASQSALAPATQGAPMGAGKYYRRMENAKALIADFAWENEQRLVSGQWTLVQLKSVLADPKIEKLQSLLSSGSFTTAIELVQGLTGGVYTPELKDAWISKIQGAM